MIIYRDNQPPLLSDYGIQVPMLKGRAEQVKSEIEKKFGQSIFSSRKADPVTEEDISRVHTKEFIERCKKQPEEVVAEAFELINADGSYHRYDPTYAKKDLSEMVSLYVESCEASFLCLEEAFKHGFAYYLGGGFHHALSNQGRGFCLLNDIMISAKKFQSKITPGLIWVIDIDAHKGCGTAEISQRDDSVLSLSIHMKNGWPLDSGPYDEKGKLRPWYIASSVDIEVDVGEEDTYLERLSNGLKKIEQMSLDRPVMAIVVDGSDPYEKDALPSANLLRLSQEQCLERNLMVYKFLKDRAIPQAYLMSGGYGDKNWIIHYQFLEKVLGEKVQV